MAEFDKNKLKEMNILALAFVGDAVHTLFVRENLALLGFKKVGELSSASNKFVNAEAQEKAFFSIRQNLSEEENKIAMRARNSNFKHRAKNFSVEQYRYATAFEAVIGFLFLSGEKKRLQEFLQKSTQVVEETDEN